MVTILALIGQAFVQSGSQTLMSTALRLCQALLCVTQFVWVRNLLARGKREQMSESRIHSYRAIANVRDGLRLCVDEETEIPTRGPLHDASTFETSRRDVLRMEPHRPYAWDDECHTADQLRPESARDQA